MSTDEDLYAARIGRNMWKIAKRRAREAQMRRTMAALTDPAGRISTSGSKGPSPTQRRAPEQAAAAAPNSLAEFLRALAAELGKDDRDPDGS